jgi:purine nucleosidase
VLRRDVKLSETIGQLVMRAGTISLPGDVTPAAEFNVYFDPRSARDVFRWRATKTLVPLDATRQVMLDYSFLDKLPPESTRAGRLLRRILPVAYRAQRQEQGIEGIYLNAPVALVAMTDPELFTIQPMAGDVEMSGDLTTGATIFDRRQVPEWRPNMEVVTEAEPQAVADAIRRGLDFAGSAG